MDGRRSCFKVKRTSRKFTFVRIPLAENVAQIFRKTKDFENMTASALGLVVGRSE